MVLTNQIAYFKRSAVYFEDDECRFVVTFYVGHVVYSDQKVKTSEIPSVA